MKILKNPETEVIFLSETCKKIFLLDVRLKKSESGSDGFVEVFTGTDWRPICGTNWDLQDAEVVCRRLGFSGAQQILTNFSIPNSQFGQNFWLTNSKCRGNEKSLSECPTSVFRSTEICEGPAAVNCVGNRSTTPSKKKKFENF